MLVPKKGNELFYCQISSELNVIHYNIFPMLHDHDDIVICVALQDIISNTDLTPQILNNLLSTFKYKPTDIKNRYGVTITMNHLRSLTLPGTGSEKMCLLRLLPLILSNYFTMQDPPKGVHLLFAVCCYGDLGYYHGICHREGVVG